MITPDQIAAFWARVDTSGNCWVWHGHIATNGYGKMLIGTRSTGRKMAYTHRLAYEFTHGAIAPGLVLDHLCRNKACCRPDHLEAVSQRVNALRGAAPNVLAHHAQRCVHGHMLTPENTWIINEAKRGPVARCRQCRLDAMARYRQARAQRQEGRWRGPHGPARQAG